MRSSISLPTLAVLSFACTAVGDDKRLNSAEQPCYANRWAIVIGVNYTGRDEEIRAAGVGTLTNAEADADAVASVLVEHYGYRASGENPTLHLLKGSHATKREIERLFGKALLKDRERVTNKDSVLVFFAGHGDREKRNNLSQTLIYPYDVQAVEGKGVDDTSCVSLGFILEQLQFCEARHKLLILDSCHSGEVFKFQARSGARYDFDRDLFNAPVVQALAASAGDQQAQDGEGHSPFTHALLEALNGTTIRTSVFGASALISQIPQRVQQLNQLRGVPTRQTPRGGPLNGDGEFYFFRTTALPSDDPVAVNPASLALQTMPGLTGKWWFEETPWLIPAVRGEQNIVDSLPVTVFKPAEGEQPLATPSCLNSKDVSAVQKTLQGLTEQYIDRRPQKERMALGILLQLANEELDEKQIENLVGLFNDCPDPHLKAVVHHRLNIGDAGELYQAALNAYETTKSPTRGGQSSPAVAGLERLCWSDYGRYLLDTGETLRARSAIRNALSFAAGEQPHALFLADNLVLQSNAERALGHWMRSEQSLDTALEIASSSFSEQHPYIATIHDRYAWLHMDRWQLDSARQSFHAALNVRRQQLDPSIATRIGMLHNEHGLAMIDRFSGKLTEARERYHRLVDESKNVLADATSHQDSESVYARMINSLERLADCYLFSTPPEPESAYDTLQRAISLCPYLSPGMQPRTKAQLECKLSMALALAGEPVEAIESLTRSREYDQPKLVGGQVRDVEVYWNLAKAVAEVKIDPDSGRDSLRRAIEAATSSTPNQTAGRQQWELALFGSDLLLRSYDSKPHPNAKKDALLLMNLASGPFMNPANLHYLRPYHDAALGVLCDAPSRLRLRELADGILQAASGNRSRELPRNRTAIIFYLLDRNGYALVIPDHSASVKPTIISLDFGRSNLVGAKLSPELSAVCDALPMPIDTYWEDIGASPPLDNEQFPFVDARRWRLITQN